MGVQNMSQAEPYHLLVIFPLIISPPDNKVVGDLKITESWFYHCHAVFVPWPTIHFFILCENKST